MNLHESPSTIVDAPPPHSESVMLARARFPHGMFQPEGSFRFSRDALLLADFAARLSPHPKPHAQPYVTAESGESVADLGTGCGVVGLAYLLRRAAHATSLRMVGIERNEELCTAAMKNAEQLGFASKNSLGNGLGKSSPSARYDVVPGDVGQQESLWAARHLLNEAGAMSASTSPHGPPLFDAVLCNPPWRREGTGRVPERAARRAALFGDAHTLGLFYAAADKLLRRHGSLFTIAGADRLADALCALPHRLKPVRLCMVHPAQGVDAVFFMLHARKGSGAELCMESPIFLDKDKQK